MVCPHTKSSYIYMRKKKTNTNSKVMGMTLNLPHKILKIFLLWLLKYQTQLQGYVCPWIFCVASIVVLSKLWLVVLLSGNRIQWLVLLHAFYPILKQDRLIYNNNHGFPEFLSIPTLVVWWERWLIWCCLVWFQPRKRNLPWTLF